NIVIHMMSFVVMRNEQDESRNHAGHIIQGMDETSSPMLHNLRKSTNITYDNRQFTSRCLQDGNTETFTSAERRKYIHLIQFIYNLIIRDLASKFRHMTNMIFFSQFFQFLLLGTFSHYLQSNLVSYTGLGLFF